jgi:PilZ domain
LETYVVRIYRHEKNKPRSIIGIVEEVGSKGKKAFTTYDELWSILKTVKRNPRESKRHEVSSVSHEVLDRRNEVRARTKIPLSFLFQGWNVNASIINVSQNGLRIMTRERIDLPLGDNFDFRVRGRR